MPAAVEKPYPTFFRVSPFSYVCRLANGEDIRRRKARDLGRRESRRLNCERRSNSRGRGILPWEVLEREEGIKREASSDHRQSERPPPGSFSPPSVLKLEKSLDGVIRGREGGTVQGKRYILRCAL